MGAAINTEFSVRSGKERTHQSGNVGRCKIWLLEHSPPPLPECVGKEELQIPLGAASALSPPSPAPSRTQHVSAPQKGIQDRKGGGEGLPCPDIWEGMLDSAQGGGV